ncbi:hypothetical protein QTG54_016537 [Skeletonema marinoi]|uniref:Uncharacterized protein n=1 Tax=Skeletonema marinoi TaxID=267567 RepID=A0AAD9D4P3_9STRA|nr:hypothetical protein QTG54_016537 [Skeletonema marinoi]
MGYYVVVANGLIQSDQCALLPSVITDVCECIPAKAPTPSPVAATDPPTSSPTKNPTLAPIASTDPPTSSPTKSPTLAPIASTDPPSSSPTKTPTLSPVPDPTKEPTFAPITPTPTKAKMPTSFPTTFGKAAKSKSSKGARMAETSGVGCSRASSSNCDGLLMALPFLVCFVAEVLHLQ